MTAAVLPACADIDVARGVLGTEARALRALAAGLDDRFGQAVDLLAGRLRPRRRLRHGQVRPCRPQDRRHPGLHRHAGAVRPSRRGLPRRSRHDRDRRRRPGPLQLRRNTELADLVRHSRRFALPLVAITARARSALAQRRRRRAAVTDGRRSLPDGTGPDHQHHHADGARRRPGGRAADPARLHRRRLPSLPSRRPARRPAGPRARPDA